MSRSIVIWCLLFQLLPMAAYSQDSLAGKRLMIRRYTDLETNPIGYESIPAEIKSDRDPASNMTDARAHTNQLALDPKHLNGNGWLVLMGRDQDDPGVAKLLTGAFCALAYKDGRVFPKDLPATSTISLMSFHRTMLYEMKNLTVPFVDALGKPVAGATVEPIAFAWQNGQPIDTKPVGPLIGQFKTDDKGNLELPWPMGAADHYYYIVSHENYGTCWVRGGALRSPARLPLLPAGSPGRERALNGRVLLPDGTPAAGATILVSEIRTPGSGSAESFPFCVVSGPDGRFCGYPCNHRAHQNVGELIPPASTYDCRVGLPSDPSQPKLFFTCPNGAETEIKLVRGNRLRRFVFEDSNGPITDPERLNGISIAFEGKSQESRVGYRWPDAAKQRWYLPGKYSATRYSSPLGPKTGDFNPVTIAENSPDTLAFRLVEEKGVVYEGRVIDATTNRPIAGAIVDAGGSIKSRVTGRHLSNMTHQEWEALHKLPADPMQRDPALGPIGQIEDFARIGRTGPDGRYRLVVNDKDPVYRILAAEENYIGVRQNVSKIKREGTISVDDIMLFPAATISFRIANRVERNLDFHPAWLIDRASVPNMWTEYFFPSRPRANMEYEYFDWLATNADIPVTSYTLHVPVGVKLGVVMTPRNDQWRPIKVTESITLARGEHRDLGEFTIRPAALVPVQVLGADGLPIEGAPAYCGWSSVHNTDATGTAHFFVEPGTKGEFSVRVKQDGKDLTLGKVAYDCPEGATELPMLTITLTPDQQALLQETLKPKAN